MKILDQLAHGGVVPADRSRAVVEVYGILRDDNHVLLIRRAGSGYRDGALSLPAGHIDGGEDAKTALVRELAEELKITVEPEACQLSVVVHRAPETAADHEYVDFFFVVDRWVGTPKIGEPAKCSELVWSQPHLPADTIGYSVGP